MSLGMLSMERRTKLRVSKRSLVYRSSTMVELCKLPDALVYEGPLA
jgi:hypothetical protein